MAGKAGKAAAARQACPCGGKDYASCCGRFHRGDEAMPADAQTLMRSRYSAYVLGETEWLRQSWHPSTCPADLAPDPATRWLGLEVKSHLQHDADHAEVEFVARYKIGGRAWRLHERSRFVREPRVAGEPARWLYVDGDMLGEG